MIFSFIHPYSPSQQWRIIFAIFLVVVPRHIQGETMLELQTTPPDVSVNTFSWCNDLIDALSEGALTLGTFAACSAAMTLYKRFTDAAAPMQVKSNRAEPDQNRTIAMQAVVSRPVFPRNLKSVPAHVVTSVATTNRRNIVPDDGRSWRVGKPAKSPSSKLAVMTAFATPARAPSTFETDALAAAVRSGKFLDMPRLLDAAFHRASLMYKDDHRALKAEATQHLLSTLRACANVHRHREALSIFSHMANRIDDQCSNVWSLLLYNAIEAGAFDKCAECVDKLSAKVPLSSYDLVNIVRYHAHWHDIVGLHQLIQRQDSLGTKIDAITRNRALAACVTEGALEVAESLLTGNVWRESLDTVGYNTLIKGYSRAGQVSKCFDLHAQMKHHGQRSSEVTFGILLDACISSRDLNGARHVFQDLRNSGLRMNAVHFTTFIKGLVAAGDFQEADAVLQDMLSSAHAEPDLITYSTLVKAYADRGQVESAVGILKQMLSRHVEPDEVIFNSLLNGCVCRHSPMLSSEVFAVFDQLIDCGLKPSAATLSILLKSLVRGEAWEVALQLLRDVPSRFNMETEPRLYAQLAQACITAGQGTRLQQVYKAFLASAASRDPQTSENINGRLLKQCIRCTRPEFASMLLDAALQADSWVEPRVVAMVRDATQRKGKPRTGFARSSYA